MSDADVSAPMPGPAPSEQQVELFRCAVRDGDAARLRELIEGSEALRARIDEPWFSFDSPAIVAAAGDRGVVDVLLDFGADINARSKWWAGGFGVLDGVDGDRADYLISRGAVVDANAAAHLGMLDRLEALAAARPEEVRRRGGDGQTPLHVAASPAIAAFLLDHGAEIEARDVDHGSTPAQYALVERPDVCRYLVGRGAEPDIFIACALGDVELAKRVLQAEPEALAARIGTGKFTSGESSGGHIYLYTLGYATRPLHLAAERGHEELVRHLLMSASPRERLLLACSRADEAAARKVLAEYPDLLDALRPEDRALISDAAWENQIDAVRLMLDLGWDVDARGVHASTPLDRAATRGFHALVELLLARGASLDVKNEFGGTPLGACVWGSLHFRDSRGDYAACVESLLRAGAPVPARAGGSPEVAALLRKAGVAVPA